MKKIRVMLADDHALVRAGFRLLLNEIPDIEVVAEAGEGYEVLRQIREKLPDVVLMDIAMPGLNGLEISARISKEIKGVRIIFLSMHDDREYVMQALNVGAAGYVSEKCRPQRAGACRTIGVERRTLSQPGRLQAAHRRLYRPHAGEADRNGGRTRGEPVREAYPSSEADPAADCRRKYLQRDCSKAQPELQNSAGPSDSAHEAPRHTRHRQSRALCGQGQDSSIAVPFRTCRS